MTLGTLLTAGVTGVLRGLIVLYRYSLSFFIGQRCRFIPSCSVYADEALRLYGPWRGSRLALRRFLRCRPGGGAGFDPVPPSFPPCKYFSKED